MPAPHWLYYEVREAEKCTGSAKKNEPKCCGIKKKSYLCILIDNSVESYIIIN